MSGRNPTELSGATLDEQLQDLSTRTYKEQAIWFLNGFWESHSLEGDAENFWQYVHTMQDLDIDRREAGYELDEFQAHRFLELLNETLTVRAMRTKLTEMGVEKVKHVPLAHYLMFKYSVDPAAVAAAPQGSNQEELEEAERMLAEVQAAFEEARRTAEAAAAREADAKAAHAEAKRTEAAAIERESAARDSEAAAKESEAQALAAADAAAAAEEEARQAQAELEAALAELHAQEEAYNNKTEELKKKSEEGGIVSRNRAKNELAQHLGEDPLPLRRAKINQEAAVRKAEKATAAAAAAREEADRTAAAASAAREAAEADAAAATAAREEAEAAASAAAAAAAAAADARAAADAAVDDCEKKMAEAEAYLEEVKAKPGQAFGAMWWIDRELHEAKKYMPTKKGGIAK